MRLLPFSPCSLPCHLQEMGQTPSAPPGTCCQNHSSCKNYELICWLKENPDLVKKYLRHLQNCYLQEDILQG